jgi:RNA polymerase sigma factor (sigma-70 family)
VHNPAAFPFDYSLYISESSALEGFAGAQGHPEWTEDEIAAVRTVLHKLTSIRILNPTDAEDLVQETILTMLKKSPGCELEKGLLVWSMGILRKKVGNYYRKAQRFTSFSEQGPGAQGVSRELAERASPEAKLSHRELQRLLSGMVRQFPSAQRRAMELFIAGLDSGEIARQLHPESYQNVINRIYRGRKKLAKELAKYGYGPDAKSSMARMKLGRGKK